MGVDIHLSICKGKEYIEKEIFDGRNRAWFDNLCGNGWDDEYDHLPIKWGLPAEAPVKIVEDYEKKDCYYDFRHLSVGDFCEWFEKYRPDLKAGWVSTYDKWRMERKGYIPEDLPIALDEDDCIEDMHFIEYENIYDCSRWLYEHLTSRNIDPQATLIYYFDC